MANPVPNIAGGMIFISFFEKYKLKEEKKKPERIPIKILVDSFIHSLSIANFINQMKPRMIAKKPVFPRRLPPRSISQSGIFQEVLNLKKDLDGGGAGSRSIGTPKFN